MKFTTSRERERERERERKRGASEQAPLPRPLQAIAFSVATSPSTIPKPEAHFIASSIQHSSNTNHQVTKLFNSVGIKDDQLIKCFYNLSLLTQNENQLTDINILIAYSVLRRLAVTSTEHLRDAAHDAVWLVFCSVAKQGPLSTTVTYPQWERIAILLGDTIGGVDSPPAQHALEALRNAWRQTAAGKVRRIKSRIVADLTNKIIRKKPTDQEQLDNIDGLSLNFEDVLVALRLFDGGLVVALRTLGIVLVDAVRKFVQKQLDRKETQRTHSTRNDYASGRQQMSPTVKDDHDFFHLPDLDIEATLLSQFSTVTLERLEEEQEQRLKQIEIDKEKTEEENKEDEIEMESSIAHHISSEEQGETSQEMLHIVASDDKNDLDKMEFTLSPSSGAEDNEYQNQNAHTWNQQTKLKDQKTNSQYHSSNSRCKSTDIDEISAQQSHPRFPSQFIEQICNGNNNDNNVGQEDDDEPCGNLPSHSDASTTSQSHGDSHSFNFTRSPSPTSLLPPSSPRHPRRNNSNDQSTFSRLSNAAKIRRANGRRGGKTPFHIDYASLQFGERIGAGAHAEVHKATYLMSPVAVKVFHVNLKTPFSSNEDMEDEMSSGGLNELSAGAALTRFASTNSQSKYLEFVREVELMSVVRHPNLVLYMGASGDPFTPLCIVSELFTGGSLHDYLHNDPDFQPPLNVSLSFALNIARGMFYLHSSQPSILHRDLKARNVLLSGRRSGHDQTPHVVICDFGLCQLFNADRSTKDRISCNGQQDEMGTAAYMSPNAINGERYSAEDDVYSYGVLLHEIFTGTTPYHGKRTIQIICQVVSNGLRPTSSRDDEIPKPVRELMELCWDKDRDHRPPFNEIITALDGIISKTGGSE